MGMPQPGPTRPQLSAAAESLLLQANPDNVLQAGAALLGEARRLRKAMGADGGRFMIGLCGRDPVSEDAMMAFNERIGALLEQCWRHIDDLEGAAQALAETARRYGYTEDQITAAFRTG